MYVRLPTAGIGETLQSRPRNSQIRYSAAEVGSREVCNGSTLVPVWALTVERPIIQRHETFVQVTNGTFG